MGTGNLTRRQFIAGTGAAALTLPFINVRSACSAQGRPNFVFILLDDMRWDAMSNMGHPFLRTPNMDRIAREGARFENAFVTIALCSPSRACFLTGRYAHSHGVKDNKTPLSDDIPTFPQVLQKGGYDTAYVGKWHQDGQEGPRPGFNRWISFKGQGDYENPMLNIDGEKVKTGGYMTDLLTRHAVDWLKQPKKSPFCLYLGHKAVHGPFTPALRHSQLFSDTPIPRPKSFTDDLKGKPAYVAKRSEIKDPEGYERFVRNYNRALLAVDEGVGQVLSTLADQGVLDNTIVVYTSDNGFFLGEHGLRDKRSMYEESIRIPFLMRYPALIRPGARIQPMVLNIDICPTFLDLAGLEVPVGVQGRSFKPLLSGRSEGWRSDWYYEYFYEGPFITPTIRGVRTERWKYTEHPEIEDTSELYDLRKDPYELNNLIADPSSASVLADMRGRLQRLIRETNALA